MTGTVTMSLEVELGWGVARFGMLDKIAPGRERETRRLNALLDRCTTHDVPMTFNVVGHLFLESCDGDHEGPYPEGWFDVDAAWLRSPDGRETRVPLPDHGRYAAVCPRLELDDALVDLARDAGATLHEGVTVRDVEVHDDFGFWLGEDATPEQKAALEEMNDTAVPMARVEGAPTAFWCHMSGRSYIRWILGQDEDTALEALARLSAAGEHTLGEGTELLGAFRAAGLLVPVIEVDASSEAGDHAEALGELQSRYDAALAESTPLTDAERRAKNGLVSRQVTLR